MQIEEGLKVHLDMNEILKKMKLSEAVSWQYCNVNDKWSYYINTKMPRDQFLQYMEGIIDDNNVYYPQSSVTTHLMPEQESIYLGAFICGSDATCWALDCQLNK